jgi:hypothetical protein
VSTWAQNLADGSTKAIDMTAADAANRERRLSLTLMLNAAWLARVRPDPAHDAAAEDVEEIGKRAVERMLQHIRPRKEREDSRDSPNVNRLP